MKEPPASSWTLAILGPIALLVLAAPLLGALQRATDSDAVDAPESPRWQVELTRMDAELAAGNASAARRAWHAAYADAVGSRRWEPMVGVADAYLRIGDAIRARRASEPKARASYLIALFRARHQGSVDGVLQVARSFAKLGDHDVVDQSLRMANDLASAQRDPAALERVRREAEHLSDRGVVAIRAISE